MERDSAPIGGKPKRKNQQAQAKARAEALKEAEVASSSQATNELTFQEDGIYYLPKKKIITEDSRLHSMLLIGYGVTREGKLYFIGQNSYGDEWGCKGYAQIFIENKCDIFLLQRAGSLIIST